MKKNNKKAMSIVLAIVLTIIMSLIAIYMINYIIPFSRNVKWIENVAKAYYQSEKAVENSLFYIKNNFWTNSWKTFNSSKSVDYSDNIIANWRLLPPNWMWNSEYNNNFNRIKVWEPIQLKIWNWRLSKDDWNSINFSFQVPDLDWDWSNDETLSWANTTPIINWQLIAWSWVLNASWSQIMIWDLNSNFTDIKLFNWSKQNKANIAFVEWVDLDWNTNNFKDYYDSNCWVWNECILKMSVINKLELNSKNTPVPYLEWKIDLSWLSVWKTIPLRYTQLDTAWKAYWFKKTIDLSIPQQTVNEAFDFTVFQ